MNTIIGAKLANMEATLMQVVGIASRVACKYCEKEYGTFSHCMTAPGVLECMILDLFHLEYLLHLLDGELRKRLLCH